MRFPIDVVFLKTAQGSGNLPQTPSPQPKAESVSSGIVVKVIRQLQPWRMAWAKEAETVIELPPGTIERTLTQSGEHVVMSRASVQPIS